MASSRFWHWCMISRTRGLMSLTLWEKASAFPARAALSQLHEHIRLPSPNLEWHTKILAHSGFSGHLRSTAILRSTLIFQRYRGLHAFISYCLNSCCALFVRFPQKTIPPVLWECWNKGFHLEQRGGINISLTYFSSDYVQMVSWPGSMLSARTFDCLTDHTLHDRLTVSRLMT